MTRPERTARHFVRRWGRVELRRFIDEIDRGVNMREIADRLGVTRQRVAQLRDRMGVRLIDYRLHPEIQRIVDAIADVE